MSSMLIKGAIVVTQNAERSIINGDVYIEDNRIGEIASHINVGADYEIDASGKILMPGLINTHTHVGMSSMRGYADDISLDRFLDKTFAFDKGRSYASIYGDSLISIQEMLETGTTSFLDLYYGEDTIAKAAERLGARAFLAWVVLDKEYTTQKGTPLANAEHFVRKFAGKDGLISPEVGLQGIYVCSDETLLSAMELAERYGRIITMHLAETVREVEASKKKHGKGPIEYLDSIGFLNWRLIAAHVVHAYENDIMLLARRGVTVSHNPASNMKLGNGIAPVYKMLKAGINVTIGTDSVASNNSLDMFQSIKLAALLQKGATRDPSALTAQQALDLATVNAAKALGVDDKIGSIEEGKLADLVLLDPRPNGLPLSRENAVSNIVYALEGLNVEMSIINGKIVFDKNKRKKRQTRP
ncbi:MAG: amidohydrolase family protein [Candidatus Micrarchaeaceae archaeon]